MLDDPSPEKRIPGPLFTDSNPMYRKPRFLEELHAIREEMSRECDYDVDLFAEMARSGQRPGYGPARNIRGFRTRALPPELPDRKSHSGHGND